MTAGDTNTAREAPYQSLPLLTLGRKPLYTLDEVRDTLMRALVCLYHVNAPECARLCDEELDRSGGLLGQVRDLVLAENRV